jgi:PAS domain S-box-containing protein
MANPAMCNFFGYSSFTEFKKLNIRDIYLNPEERKSFLGKLKKFGFINGFETRGKKKDGSLLYLRISASTVENKDGEIIFYDGILEDYTEKKLMERKLLKAKEEAENADRLKSAFLANMSHEVRTPMNGIMGFSNLLQKPDLTNELRIKYTNIIRNRGEDLLRIINDILDVSKLEVSQLKLYKKDFSLRSFMNQLYVVYKQKLIDLGKDDVKLELNNDYEDEDFILCEDETRINQILTNYIDNAIKFTESGSIEIGYEVQYNSIIQFYVKDTGIGVPEEMQKVIFERFRQYDESPTRIYGGNGLGLAICKGLAELMQGSVSVKSKEKKGSVFYFKLPANFHNKIQDNDMDAKQYKYNWRGKKILVVEDDEISSALIEEYFEATNATVKVAMDGYSALRTLKDDKNFNLVLLDIGLPDISGLVVVKQIKRFYPNIPVIAQTAYAMQDDELKCKDAGCDDYLQKPIVKELMLEKAGEYLNIN